MTFDDIDIAFGGMEMLREDFDNIGIGLAVMSWLVRADNNSGIIDYLDRFGLGIWFNKNAINHVIIITRSEFYSITRGPT